MRLYAGIITLAILAASPVLAQEKLQRREGFTIGFGLGGGSAAFTCRGCDSKRESGTTFYLRLGDALRSDLIIGGETSSFFKVVQIRNPPGGSPAPVGTRTIEQMHVTAYVQWYPQPARGFFVKGGPGLGVIVDETLTYASDVHARSEIVVLSLSLGIGYDWRLGKNFSLSPYMNVTGTTRDVPETNRTASFPPGEAVGGNLFAFGLGFTWH